MNPYLDANVMRSLGQFDLKNNKDFESKYATKNTKSKESQQMEH